MVTLTVDYSHGGRDPTATLRISLDAVDEVLLSVSNRAVRNRSALYQAKHAVQSAGLATRVRDPVLAALNIPIAGHYEPLARRLADRRVIAFPISDLTANPLRPHYDAFARDGERLFYLLDEPIAEARYTVLACRREQEQTRLAIRHDVAVTEGGALGAGVLFWMACPPLLIAGEYHEEEYAVRDYDLRHSLGFPDHYEQFGYSTKAAHEQALYAIYRDFRQWEAWCDAIRRKLSESPARETGYHAALGLSATELFLVHRTTETRELARELRQLGAVEAVLLDSGGSCAIWANWVNGNRGSVLASAWNYRPARGAVVFLVLKGERGLPVTAR
jgi:hypothetical protein